VCLCVRAAVGCAGSERTFLRGGRLAVRGMGRSTFSTTQTRPRFFLGDVDECRTLEDRRREDGQEDQVALASIVSPVDYVDRDMRRIARSEEAFLAIHPLFGSALDHIDDFFHRGMPMELMGLSVRHGDADEQEFLRLGQAGPAEPFMGTPRELFDLDVIGLDETEHDRFEI